MKKQIGLTLVTMLGLVLTIGALTTIYKQQAFALIVVKACNSGTNFPTFCSTGTNPASIGLGAAAAACAISGAGTQQCQSSGTATITGAGGSSGANGASSGTAQGGAGGTVCIGPTCR